MIVLLAWGQTLSLFCWFGENSVLLAWEKHCECSFALGQTVIVLLPWGKRCDCSFGEANSLGVLLLCGKNTECSFALGQTVIALSFGMGQILFFWLIVFWCGRKTDCSLAWGKTQFWGTRQHSDCSILPGGRMAGGGT